MALDEGRIVWIKDLALFFLLSFIYLDDGHISLCVYCLIIMLTHDMLTNERLLGHMIAPLFGV